MRTKESTPRDNVSLEGNLAFNSVIKYHHTVKRLDFGVFKQSNAKGQDTKKEQFISFQDLKKFVSVALGDNIEYSVYSI